MTEQEVFNKMVDHLRKQGYKRSQREDGACVYRGEGGRMCAVGCLLPDELYTTTFEGKSAMWICKKLTEEKWPAAKFMILLDEFQLIHDLRMDTPERAEAEFWRVAKRFSLKYTKPTALTECTTQGAPA